MSAPSTPNLPVDGPCTSRLPRPLLIGLSALVLVIVGVGLRFGVPIWRQQAAIREIEQVGGRIEVENGGPDWLRRYAGDDWMKPFDKVTMVNLVESHATDDTLAYVSRFRNLQRLYLDEVPVTDVGMAHLRGLTGLIVLDISRTQINDASIANLSGMSKLETLFLDDVPVTSTGLAHFARLTNLTSLHLRGTQIDDSGLKYLRMLTKLRVLAISRTPIGDAGLLHIVDMKELEVLDLAKTHVSDTGVAALSKLKQPSGYSLYLDLRETQISDSGVEALRIAIPGITLAR